jgi:hypothetical protein
VISVIVPTVAGREAIFERTIAAYRDTLAGIDYELIAPRNYDAIGKAWQAGLDQAHGDLIQFGLDNAIPQAGWYDAARSTLAKNVIPAAWMSLENGDTWACGSLGGGLVLSKCADWTPCRQSGLWCATDVMCRAVGSFLPIHYYTDDDWFWRAQLSGYTCVVRLDYHFVRIPIKDRHNAAINDKAAEARQAYLDHAQTFTGA